MSALATDVLREFVRRRREEEMILAIVLDGFEPAQGAKVKRSQVYSFVASRLNRPVSNELSNAIRSAVSNLPGVMLVASNGRAWFDGLAAKS